MNIRLVFVNGKILSDKDPAIPANDAGFLHGLGIYETLAVENGKPSFLAEHLERMEDARKFLRISKPAWDIRKSIKKLLAKSKVNSAALRITLTRGVGEKPTLAMSLRKLPKVKAPVKLAVSRFVKFSEDPWEKIKTTCRARNLMAREEAEKLGAFDALFRSNDGDFVEGSVTNFYIIQKQTILTPPLSRGILPGVTRDKIFKACRRLRLSLKEAVISPTTLKKADAVFVSNALIGVLEVKEIIGFWKARAASHPILEQLRDFYQQQVLESSK